MTSPKDRLARANPVPQRPTAPAADVEALIERTFNAPPAAAQRRRRVSPAAALAAALVFTGTGVGAAAVVGAFSGGAPDSPDDVPPRAPTVTSQGRPVAPAQTEARRRQRQRQPQLDAGRYFTALRAQADERYLTLTSTTTGTVQARATDREICIRVLRTANSKSSSGSCLPTVKARTGGVMVYAQCFKPPYRPQHRIVSRRRSRRHNQGHRHPRWRYPSHRPRQPQRVRPRDRPAVRHPPYRPGRTRPPTDHLLTTRPETPLLASNWTRPRRVRSRAVLLASAVGRGQTLRRPLSHPSK